MSCSNIPPHNVQTVLYIQQLPLTAGKKLKDKEIKGSKLQDTNITQISYTQNSWSNSFFIIRINDLVQFGNWSAKSDSHRLD